MSEEPDSNAGLNVSHRSHLLAYCQQADKLLGDIEQILRAAESKTSFPKYIPDITPAEARTVEDYIRRMREQILRVLQPLGIHPPPAPFGSRHSIQVTLVFVRIAFQEIGPKNLRGYGAFPEKLVPEIDGLIAEMLGLVDRLDSFLRATGEENLTARVAEISSGLPPAAELKILAATIESEGLVELRPTLLSIVDRLTDPQFEVAVFGQVSTGKSSLLNHILGADLLPVGVNPITAVPTRIRFGSTPSLTISYADRHVEEVAVDRLPEFATEQANPSNAKGIVRIEMKYPAPRLQTGVVLVDTPGLGSLATAGARETLAYLPRCDCGVLLINASSTVAPADIRTLLALKLAGVPFQVLLSKADLLTPLERTASSGYLRDTLRSQLGSDVEVACVSIAGREEHLLSSVIRKRSFLGSGRP